MINSLIITDSQGRIEPINRAILELLEYKEEELLGKTLGILFENQLLFNNGLKELIKKGNIHNKEEIFVKKSGEKLSVLFSCSFIIEGSNIKSIICIANDISAQKKMEDSLRESEESYRMLFHQSLDPIYTFDVVTNKILETNNAFLNYLGYTKEDLPTLTLSDFVAHDKKSIDRFIQPLLDAGSSQLRERKWRKKNGDFINVLISANRIKQKGKDIIFVIAHNVTEEKKAQSIIEHERKARQIAISDAQEEERHRIATELHDGLGQILTAISYSIDNDFSLAIKRNTKQQQSIKKIQDLIDNAINETKRVAYDLIPILLKDFGLIPAINSLVKQIHDQNKIYITFNEFHFTERIDKKLETALYRITQEALNNIIKHSKAKNANIQIVRHPSSIILIIDDDGIGFEVDKEYNSSKQQWRGIGIISMRERVQAFDGTMTIDSSPKMGTEILVEIPYKT